MNFDIKYTKNLQRFNFIKIKQALGAFLGTQSWGSITEVLNNSGCVLGAPKKRPDNGARSPATEIKKAERKKRERFTKLVFHLTWQADPTFRLSGSYRTRPSKQASLFKKSGRWTLRFAHAWLTYTLILIHVRLMRTRSIQTQIRKLKSDWFIRVSLTVGPHCQSRLLPLNHAEEREENEFEQSKPLQDQLFSLTNR